MKRILTGKILVLSIAMMLCALPAFSQTLTGNITARATDSTGAVIPGVEVAISSPSMIGGARTEVTDESGSYRFTLLTPGTYRVTFSLPGFKTTNYDGVVLAGGSTMTQVGVMQVAATAEEVTVNSQSPTIDLESATVGVNISQKMMDDLPWSRSLTGMSMMIPGVFSTSFDIGNSNFGTSSTIAARSGGRSGGNVVSVDGLVWCQSYSDYGSFEEMNVSTNAKGADQMNSGITLAMVVKSGGNSFHGNVSTNYQNGSMQSNNISQSLIDQGFSTGSNKYTHFTDYYGDIGGPIKKDKLWFYTAWRWGYQGTYIPGFVTAVGGKLTDFYTVLKSPSAKLTYQLTPKQKLEAYVGIPDKFQPYRGGSNIQPKEATQDQDSWSSQGPMLTYTNIIDAKTTFTAKITRGGYWWPAYTYGFNDDAAGLGPNIAQLVNGQLVMKRIPTMTFQGVQNVGVHISDNTTSAVDGAFNSNYARPIRWQENADFSRFANIMGKNNELKVGYMGWWDKDYTLTFGYPNQQQYIYKSASTDTCPEGNICDNFFKIPYRVTVYDYPNKSANGALYRAGYINDKVTMSRKLTLNAGLRMDWATTFLPAQGNDGTGPFAQKFVIKEKQDYYQNADGTKSQFPVYHLWSPRLSFAYDVFGNGRVAIKGSYGRYIGITSSPNSQPGQGSNNPISTTSCTYNNWDGSIPYVPNFGAQNYLGSPTNVNLNAACAKLQTLSDGTVAPLSTYHYDDSLAPSYVNEFAAGLEVGFNRTYSLRFNVSRKFDRQNAVTVNLNTPFNLYTDLKCATDPGRDGVLSVANGGPAKLANGNPNLSADDNPVGPACYYSVPKVATGAFDPVTAPTNTLYRGNNESLHEGDNSYTGYTLTFNRNYANRFQFVTSYDIDLAHSNTNNPLTPNTVISNGRAAPTVWSQSFKTSGTYGLPDIPLLFGKKLGGVQYGSTFVSQSGGWYGRSATVTDGRGTAQSLTMEAHVGRYPWLNDWDQNIRKKFKITDKQSVEVTWQLFNSLNAATIQSWKSTSTASSSYLQPVGPNNTGTQPLRPSSVLSPRIYEWGISYKF